MSDDHLDDRHRDQIIEEITLHLIAAYGYVIKALRTLPIPIDAPAAITDQYSSKVEKALTRAIILIRDLPMDDTHREHVKGLVIDWLTAADYLESLREDFQWWHAEFIVTQLYRVGSRWATIQNLGVE